MSMDQLVAHEGAAKRDIWKQKVKNLFDEHRSLLKSWEKDARRYNIKVSILCDLIFRSLPLSLSFSILSWLYVLCTCDCYMYWKIKVLIIILLI